VTRNWKPFRATPQDFIDLAAEARPPAPHIAKVSEIRETIPVSPGLTGAALRQPSVVEEISRMIRLLALLALLLPLGLRAEVPVAYVEGTHYTRLPEAVRTADPARIEVVEVFWYGCSHCYQFEPLLAKWQQALPKDVDFRRSPALWNKPMAIHAQAFYAAQALGVLEKMHEPLFRALNVDRKRLDTEDELAALFAANGVKEDDFRKAFNSFGVQASVKQADARARSYRVSGTPEVIVNGKFSVSARTAGSPEAMLKVIDFLLAKERSERAAG
jgi:protein dithiol oxidoreductase (disulfide-forming)